MSFYNSGSRGATFVKLALQNENSVTVSRMRGVNVSPITVGNDLNNEVGPEIRPEITEINNNCPHVCEFETRIKDYEDDLFMIPLYGRSELFPVIPLECNNNLNNKDSMENGPGSCNVTTELTSMDIDFDDVPQHDNSPLISPHLCASYDPGEGTSSSYKASIVDWDRPTVLKLRRSSSVNIEPSSSSSEFSNYDSDKEPHFSGIVKDYSSSNENSNLDLDHPGHEMRIPDHDNEAAEEPESGASKKKLGRKRKADPQGWITNKVKHRRNSGQEYKTVKTQKLIRARKVQPSCGDKCRIKCSSKITGEIREKLFAHYWGLANLQRQREFIASLSSPIKPKYRYSSTQSLRKLNSAFYFDVELERIRVCKKFFMATLDINERIIKTALSKKTETGFVLEDKRGKHGNQPTLDPEIKDSVRKFIEAIPRVESHYLRAQTTREFIESGKSLADLHRDYVQCCQEKTLPFANLTMFSRIFNTEYNISFFKPKKDLCDLCESYKNADEEGKLSIAESYFKHRKETELSRKEKDEDKHNSDGKIVAVYDLQAVLPLPRGLISSFFYKSKMNCFNFTISDLFAKNVECYFWNETDAKRGAIEIGSCVYQYLKALKEKTGDRELDVIFYSDNCCGQQKNKFVLGTYAYATIALNIRSITHKFLIRGHSENEGDNVHSVIEKQVNKFLKKPAAAIYVPEQYITLIETAKKTGPGYHVNVLTNENFYDLKLLAESWGSNFNIDIDNNKLNWHDIKVMRVERDHRDSFYYKTSYEDTDFKKILTKNTRKTRISRNQEPQEDYLLEMPRAYSGKFPLSENKKKDLKDLCDRNIIPKYYFNTFYKNVFNL